MTVPPAAAKLSRFPVSGPTPITYTLNPAAAAAVIAVTVPATSEAPVPPPPPPPRPPPVVVRQLGSPSVASKMYLPLVSVRVFK